MSSQAFERAQMVLRGCERLLVITGAGISTGSGIDDYRDEAGRWKRPQPVTHQDFMASAHWRQRYWARSQVGFPQFMRASPNAAHRALADWESTGRMRGLITQNVDRLHQSAGHRAVLDLHGRLDQVVCTACGSVLQRSAVQSWLQRHNPELSDAPFAAAPDGDADVVLDDVARVRVPDCQRCGGVLKPHVVFFGDSVPRSVVDKAYGWVDDADALLVVGSSLMVYSSFRFVRRAHQRGLPILAVNRGATRADDMLLVKLDDDCENVLPQLELGARTTGRRSRGVH